MNNPTRTVTVSVKSLPPSLRNLVKRTGFRPATVEVALSVMPAEVISYYRTGEIFSMGDELAKLNTSWVGSDFEPNPQTTFVFSAPTAIQVKKLGARSKNGVRISVGGLYPFRAEIEGDEEISAYRLSVMVDFALSEQL